MPCDIIYSGKKYSLAEFVGLLSDGELVAKINDNTISGALADKYKEAFSNEFQASVNIINKVRDAAEKIAGAFLNRFGINVNIINSEQLGKMLATDENAKEFFFKILDEIDVFSSQNLDEAKSFITRVFQTVENKEDAKKAYRKLAVKYHPDKQGSEEIMKHLNDINEKYQKGLIKPQETPTSENKKYKDWAEKVYKKAEAETKAYEYARRQGSGVYEQYGQKQTERKPEGERYQNINRERYSSGQQQQQQQQQPKTKSEPKNKGFWSSIFDLFTKPSTPNPKSQPKSEVLTNERRDEIKSDLIKKREKLKQDNSKKLKEFEDINSKLYNTNKITSEQFYQRNKDARDNFYEKNKKIDDWYYDLVGKIDKAYYNKTPFTYKQYIGDKIGGIYNPVTFESYIVLDNLDETSFIHEAFSHPFIEAIKVRNPKLYDNLLAESKNEAQIVDYVNENYSQQPQEVKDAEYIARAIDLDAKGKLKNKKLIDYIKEFWLEANKIFKDIFGGKDAKIENIDAQTTISDIVDFVLMSNQKLDLKAATAPQEATKKDDTKQTISAAAKPIQPTTKAAAPQTETAGKAAVQQGTTTDSGRRAEGAAAVPVAAPQLGDTITITSKTDGKPIRYFYENGWKFLDSRGRTQNTTEKEAAAVTEKWAAQQKTGSIQEGMQKLADPIKIDEVVAPVMLQNKAVFDDYFKRAQAVLKTLFPNASIVLAKTNKEYTEINEKVTGRKSEYSSFGIWHPKENIIVLNGELIDKFIKNQDRPEVTAIHEVIHPIVWQASSYDPNVLNDLTEQIKELAKVGYEPAKIALQHASGIAYKEWQVPHETVTEFITMVIAGKADINKIPVSWQNKVLRLINQFLKWIGAKPIANAYDLRKLTEAVKKAFDSATDGIANVSDILDVVGRKNLQKPFLQGQGRVEIALQSYATNAQIEEWLRENLKTTPDLTVDEVIEAIAEDSRESINTTAKEAAVRKLVERIIDEQAKPTAPPPPKSGVLTDEQKGEMLGIRHADTEKDRIESGLPPYEKTVKSDDELEAETDALIESGFNFEKAIDDVLEGGKILSDAEQSALGRYKIYWQKIANADPSNKNINRYHRVLKALDMTGTLAGRALRSRRLPIDAEKTFADFLVRQMEESGVDKLTDDQISVNKKEFEELQKVKAEYEARIAKLEKEAIEAAAKQNISNKRKSNGGKKQTKEEINARIKDIKERIKEKLSNVKEGKIINIDGQDVNVQEANLVPYLKELMAIAPEVPSLVEAYIDLGIVELSEIAAKVKSDLEDSIPEITEQDVIGLIAGEYTAGKQQTKNEVKAKLRELKLEARLVSQLMQLEAGAPPATEKKKIEQNRRIAELRKKIKEHPANELPQYKRRLQSQIDRIEKDLSEERFAPEPPKVIVKVDDETRALKRKLVDLKTQREIRLLRDSYEKMGVSQKAYDKLIKIANIPRTLMASMDFSAPLRQAIIATLSNPVMAFKAAGDMFRAAKSQSFMDEWFFDLENDPDYELMKELGLGLSNPNSPFLRAREEAFMSGYVEQLEGYIGKKLFGVENFGLVKGSERAYVMYLNKMRVDLFKDYVGRLREKGKTQNTDPDVYEAVTKYINNVTGRGAMGRLEQFAAPMSALFFSPRLIASRLNLLNPVYFAKLPLDVKKIYAMDMAKFIGIGLATLGAIYMMGGGEEEDDISIELDPRSSDFMKIKKGDIRWDIWGGFQPYIRTAIQAAMGEKKQTTTGEIVEFDENAPFGETRGSLLLRFVRNKLAPLPSFIINYAAGRTSVGEKFDMYDQLLGMTTPLLWQQVWEVGREDGALIAMAVGVPSVFGVGAEKYGERPIELTGKLKVGEKTYELEKQDKVKLTEMAEKEVEILKEKVKKMPEYKGTEKLPTSKKQQQEMLTIAKEAGIKKAIEQFKNMKEIKVKYPPETSKEREARLKEEKRKKILKTKLNE